MTGCLAPDLACRLSPESVRTGEILGDVSDVGECGRHCEELPSCQFYTFYSGEAGGWLAGDCHLLSSCPHLVEVKGAVTASQRSDCTCSLEVVPSDGLSLTSLAATSEVECLLACRTTPACSHYTHHTSLAYCRLLDSPATFLPSNNPDIRTGPAACKFQSDLAEDDICRLALLNNSSHILLDQVVDDMEILVNSAIKDCLVDIELVVVGPGGSYEMLAGGGSGYVNSTRISVEPGSVIRVESRQTGGKFTFSVSVNQTEILSSTPGQDGTGFGNNTGGWRRLMMTKGP